MLCDVFACLERIIEIFGEAVFPTNFLGREREREELKSCINFLILSSFSKRYNSTTINMV
jgi:hypothetical protein